MPEPEEIQFACVGCGAPNPPGAEVCSGCGHRFREPTSVPAPVVSPENPYEAPKTRVGGVPTFRIGTAMMAIAAVACCLGAFEAGNMQGILVTMGLLPATIRTLYVAGRREAEGRPMSFERKVLTFVATIGGVILVVLSSIIAFGLICFPLGVASGGGMFAIAMGMLGAIVAAFGITIALIRASRVRAQRELDRETIRWQ